MAWLVEFWTDGPGTECHVIPAPAESEVLLTFPGKRREPPAAAEATDNQMESISTSGQLYLMLGNTSSWYCTITTYRCHPKQGRDGQGAVTVDP